VQKFIIGAPAREMKATLAELGKSAQGQQAVSDVKGHVLDSLLLKATGRRTSTMSPASLQRAALREGAGRDRARKAARALQPDGGRVAAHAAEGLEAPHRGSAVL
jgi:predicted signal transduction protein with EAL and GGDEF domain